MSLTPKLLQQGAAGSARANYIEDVFSTYLYTGNGSTQTITNGIDLSTKGGLVWMKNRSVNSSYTESHGLFDTIRGAYYGLNTDGTAASTNYADMGVSAFSTTGFSTKNRANPGAGWNNINITYASWTFREQAKFFDIVTWSGDDTTSRVLNHNLGSPPGVIIIKGLNDTFNWDVLYRVNGNDTGTFSGKLSLSGTGADIGARGASRTSTTFQLNNEGITGPNVSGRNYVAYLFAHNAGGFGVSGNDNVISCGSYTGSSSNVDINLGYEAQWVLVKNITTAGTNWQMLDIMRGMPLLGSAFTLAPNLTDEDSSTTAPVIIPTATGMTITGGIGGSINSAGSTYIYIAIRRGPMKVPTTGTSVFAPATRAGTGAAVTVTGAAFPPDFLFNIDRFGTGPAARYNYDRLRGSGQTDLRTNSTAAEGSAGAIGVSSFNMNGFSIPSTGVSFLNDGAASYINYFFGRAPSFFDVVCWTGTGADQTLNHNLQAVPELIIYKRRGSTGNWYTGYTFTSSDYLNLNVNLTNAGSTVAYSGGGPFSGQPTATQFSVGQFYSTTTMVAYLFASCPGVSKVGSYTGNGSTQTIDCGFAAGARFVLIKRTDSTGDWYIFDTARGIISGNDPFLKLNTIDAETTSYDAVDPANSGFIVNNDATNFPINVASATYIFLAIA